MTTTIDGTKGITTQGLFTNAAFSDSYTSGAILDYVTGNGRITVGSSEGILFRNGGPSSPTTLATLNSAGNLGLGVTPSAWSAGKAIETGYVGNGVWGFNNNNFLVTQNAYYNGGWKYASTGPLQASYYQQTNGTHTWNIAGAGTAGNAITFTQAMTLDNSGNLLVGQTSKTTGAVSSAKLGVTSGITITNSSYGGFIEGIGSSGTAYGYLSFGSSYNAFNAGEVGLGTSGAVPLLFATNNLERARIDSTGVFTLQGDQLIKNGKGTAYYNSANTAYWALYNSSDSLIFSNGTERARIDSSGNLLFRTPSSGSGNTGWALLASNNSNFITAICGSLIDGATHMSFQTAGVQKGYIATSGGSTIYSTSSDYRLKENIKPMVGGLEKVMQLKPVTYRWIQEQVDSQGFIAHELQEIVPQCVMGEKDAVDVDGNPVYQGIDTSFLVATLTAAIQEQQALIESLTQRVAALEA